MLKIFEKYILKEIIQIFFLISVIIFPILFISNFLINNNDFFQLILNVILFFAQIMHIVLIISIITTIKRIRYQYSDMALITSGFEKKDLIKTSFILYFLFLIFNSFLINNVNKVLFKKNPTLNYWLIKDYNNFTLIVLNYSVDSISDAFIIQNNKIIPVKCFCFKDYVEIENNKYYFDYCNLYFAWNNERILSITHLKEYIDYLKYRKIDYSKELIILHTKYIKLISYLVLIFLAFVLSFYNSNFKIFIILFFYFWIEQLSYIILFKFSLVFIIFNLLFWCFFINKFLFSSIIST